MICVFDFGSDYPDVYQKVLYPGTASKKIVLNVPIGQDGQCATYYENKNEICIVTVEGNKLF